MIEIQTTIKVLLKPVYNLLRNILFQILDYYDILKCTQNPLVPPRSMIFIGDGDYEKIGNEFLEYFRELGKLKPNSKVLDVGCGIGRMAVPLVKYLSDEGEYHGFDIVKKGIDWCSENITSKYPKLIFVHADVYNKMYNPRGKEISSEYNFSYESNYFDFVFLTSVFTHMYAKDVENYLGEISRVMKSGGRCLITFFLLNEESEKFIKNGDSSQNLKFQIDENSYTVNKNISESAIGYKEEYIKQLFVNKGLTVEESIYYGSWCGRKNYKSYQDIVIAIKK
ncbi:MAG: class I SAM-dependent methyltransferase [Bacteroidetes bacterium]|nr:class I SAM-dependent methyltransferase [Bacteroidota bacterium]